MAEIHPFDDRDGCIWLDGRLVPWREANVHVLTHGLHYASSVFEGERAYSGRIYKLDEHTERLFESANGLGIPAKARLRDSEHLLHGQAHAWLFEMSLEPRGELTREPVVPPMLKQIVEAEEHVAPAFEVLAVAVHVELGEKHRQIIEALPAFGIGSRGPEVLSGPMQERQLREDGWFRFAIGGLASGNTPQSVVAVHRVQVVPSALFPHELHVHKPAKDGRARQAHQVRLQQVIHGGRQHRPVVDGERLLHLL